MNDLHNYILRRISGMVGATMYAHSPQHLSEWAELIGAELPDEYAEKYKHGHEYDHERECKRDYQAQAEGDKPTGSNCSRGGH